MPRNDDVVVHDRRSAGYLRVYNDLYDRFGAQLGPYGLAVYMALCRYANRDSECWPSHETIAKGTGMSRRQVIREIDKMEALGVIEVERSKHSSHVYILLNTCDIQSHQSRDSQSHPCDTQSHKQDLIKKNIRPGSNKKQKNHEKAAQKYSDPPSEEPKRKYSRY